MRKIFLLLLVLLVLAPVFSTMLVVLAENVPVCLEQPDYDRGLVPWAIDPGLIQGHLLPAIPNDPNGWRVPAGPWTRTATACDPEGHPFTIKYEAGPVPVNITRSPPANTWTISVQYLPPGRHLFVFSATDEPGEGYSGPATRFVTIAVEAVMENLPPVIH